MALAGDAPAGEGKGTFSFCCCWLYSCQHSPAQQWNLLSLCPASVSLLAEPGGTAPLQEEQQPWGLLLAPKSLSS